MSFLNHEYQPLAQFFTSHFQAQSDAEPISWQSIAEQFVIEAGPDTADDIAQRIHKFLNNTKSDHLLTEILRRDFGCNYDAGTAEQTRAWLLDLSNALKIDTSYLIDVNSSGEEVYVPGLVIGSNSEQTRLSPADLLPGDVLVWVADRNQPVQRKAHYLIRDGSGGAYSHASIYVGLHGGIRTTVDAGPAGVDCNPLDELLSYFSVARVFRTALSEEKIDRVVDAALGFIGKYKYSMSDARWLPFRRRVVHTRGVSGPFLHRCGLSPVTWLGKRALAIRKKQPRDQETFCSHLVVQAYATVNYFQKQHIEEAATSPNDLASGNYFPCVGFISTKSFAGKPPPTFERDIFAADYSLSEKSKSVLYRLIWRL